MKPRSLVSRLALLQQIMALAIVTVFMASSLLLTGRALLQEEGKMLQTAAQRMADDLDSEFKEGKTLEQAALEALAEEPASKVKWEILDSRNRRLASSPGVGGEPPQEKATALRPVGEADSQSHRKTARAGCGALVAASVPATERILTVSTLARILLMAAVPLLLATLFLSRWMAARILRPLAGMTERAGALPAIGGVRKLGDPIGLDEIDRLTDSFNRLLARLDDFLQSERRFAADASHELRTPLTVLAGEIEVALAQEDLSPPSREGLARALEQARRMKELVDALLLLRRTGDSAVRRPADFEPVNLSDVVRETGLTILDRHPGRTGDLTISAPDEALVAGIPALLATAIGNLLDNAIKFTTSGQRVQVRVSMEGACARVDVDDEGPGIRPEDHDRVFDPFFRAATARNTASGFGLGLPILRQVARAHGGDVTVGLSPLGGARFTLSLPSWEATDRADS